MIADVLSQSPFPVGRARPLIDPWPYYTTVPVRNYDVMPDGSFIVSQLQGSGQSRGIRAATRQRYCVGEIHVIVNFGARLAPESGT